MENIKGVLTIAMSFPCPGERLEALTNFFGDQHFCVSAESEELILAAIEHYFPEK